MANRRERLAINRRVCDSEQRFRVIPVLLPGAKRESLPALLREHYVGRIPWLNR
jgi:hypothetical protein